MDIILNPLIQVIIVALQLYSWVVIVGVVLGWLLAFNVVNSHNQFVSILSNVVGSLTEPVLGRVRRYVPTISGVDLSCIVLLLAIFFSMNVLRQLLVRL